MPWRVRDGVGGVAVVSGKAMHDTAGAPRSNREAVQKASAWAATAVTR